VLLPSRWAASVAAYRVWVRVADVAADAARANRSTQGNLNVATRAAEEIRRTSRPTPKSSRRSPPTCRTPALTQAQQDRIVKNYVLQLKEFREITLFDEAGRPLATSACGKPRVTIPQKHQRHAERLRDAPLRVDEDAADDGLRHSPDEAQSPSGLPVRRVQPPKKCGDGGRIRIGTTAYAMVIAPDARSFATGIRTRSVDRPEDACRRTRWSRVRAGGSLKC